MRRPNKNPPRPRVVHRLKLSRYEMSKLKLWPAGGGGMQDFANELYRRAYGNDGVVDVNDAELGRLVRYVGRYGRGGPNNSLRAAFRDVLEREVRCPVV